MPMTVDQLREEIAALPLNARLELLRSVDTPDLDEEVYGAPPPGILCEDDPDFLVELKRRVDAIDNGTAVTIPYDEAIRGFRAMLEK